MQTEAQLSKSGAGPKPPVKNAAGDIVISTDDLASEYFLDKAAADKKYKGKRVEVKGSIAAVIPTPDQTIVAFNSPSGTEISCKFTMQQRAKLTALKNDQEVKIRGTCQGHNGLVVEVLNCELVP